MSKALTFIDFLKRFPTEIDIIIYWIKLRYEETGLTCPHCGSDKIYHRPKNPKLFQCSACKNHFSIFTGSIFEKSSTDLRKWFYAIRIFLNGKKGISGKQLERELGVTYKTAWRMLQQIRIAMGNKGETNFFEAIVEIDETYVGGRPRKGNKGRDGSINKRGRGTDKMPVVGYR